MCDALGACTELNGVYRRLLKMTLEELRLIDEQIGRLDQDDELIFCIRYPAFDSIRSDPRCPDLMRRLGLQE